jgi:hypothetical protein
MFQIISPFLSALIILLLNSAVGAQSYSDTTYHVGALEIDGNVISGRVDGKPMLIAGARIDHATIFPDDTLQPIPPQERTENVYYITEDGQFTLLVFAETQNFLQFTFPNHYTKKVYISLTGSSSSESGTYFSMRTDVTLGEIKYRRAKRILEKEFLGIGWYDPV